MCLYLLPRYGVAIKRSGFGIDWCRILVILAAWNLRCGSTCGLLPLWNGNGTFRRLFHCFLFCSLDDTPGIDGKYRGLLRSVVTCPLSL